MQDADAQCKLFMLNLFLVSACSGDVNAINQTIRAAAYELQARYEIRTAATPRTPKHLPARSLRCPKLFHQRKAEWHTKNSAINVGNGLYAVEPVGVLKLGDRRWRRGDWASGGVGGWYDVAPTGGN
jgi:hypothetical protein